MRRNLTRSYPAKPNLFINVREKLMLLRILQREALHSDSREENRIAKLLQKIADVTWNET